MRGDLPFVLYDRNAGRAGEVANPGASAQSRYA